MVEVTQAQFYERIGPLDVVSEIQGAWVEPHGYTHIFKMRYGGTVGKKAGGKYYLKQST